MSENEAKRSFAFIFIALAGNNGLFSGKVRAMAAGQGL